MTLRLACGYPAALLRADAEHWARRHDIADPAAFATRYVQEYGHMPRPGMRATFAEAAELFAEVRCENFNHVAGPHPREASCINASPE